MPCPCRFFPHGIYSLLISILATCAWLTSLFQDGCNFAIVSGPIVQQLDPTFTETAIPFLEFGLSAYREPTRQEVDHVGGNSHGASYNYTLTMSGSCTEYPEELVDATWKTARSFAFLAMVLGGGGTLFVWFSTCFVFSRVTWRWTGYGLLLASVCQGLVYLWFMTQLCSWNECSMSYGSKTDSLAVFFWFLAGMLIVCRYPMPKRLHQLSVDDDDDDEKDHTPSQEFGSIEGSSLPFASQGSGESTLESRQTLEKTIHVHPDDKNDDQELRYPNAEIA